MERRTYLKGITVSVGGISLAGCNGDNQNGDYPSGFSGNGLNPKLVIDNQVNILSSARVDYSFEMTINGNKNVQERTKFADTSIPTYFTTIDTASEQKENYYLDGKEYSRKLVQTEDGEAEEFNTEQKEFTPKDAFRLDTMNGVLKKADWSDVEEDFLDGEEVIKYVVTSMNDLSEGNVFFVEENALEEVREVYIEVIANKETGQLYEATANVDVSLTTGSDVKYDFSQTYSEVNSAEVQEPDWYSEQF